MCDNCITYFSKEDEIIQGQTSSAQGQQTPGRRTGSDPLAAELPHFLGLVPKYPSY